jgi:alcohol dehydrogenase (cytochrome c)
VLQKQEIQVEVDSCPSMHGVKNWRAMAYHPSTQALYVPMLLSCQKAIHRAIEQKEGGGGYGVPSSTLYMHPKSPDKAGQFLAMDIKSGRALWRHETRLPMTSAALTTAGGLAVVGDSDRYLYIHDAASGKVVFQTRLASAVQGFPITYAVNGRQYLAVPVGTGDGGWLRTGAVLTKTQPAPPVNAIFVFRLPDAAARGPL